MRYDCEIQAEEVLEEY